MPLARAYVQRSGQGVMLAGSIARLWERFLEGRRVDHRRD
jgi:hypothetical protein